MSGLSRMRGALARGVLRLVPAGRRDWVAAVWAEAARCRRAGGGSRGAPAECGW